MCHGSDLPFVWNVFTDGTIVYLPTTDELQVLFAAAVWWCGGVVWCGVVWCGVVFVAAVWCGVV